MTRKVGVNFYGFIFWLKRIFSGKLGTKNVLPIRRKHYRLAALLHDAFRKPHGRKVYLKPKQKTRTSRFLSLEAYCFADGAGIETTCRILPTNWFRVLWLNQKLLYFGGKYENISEVKRVLKTHKIGVFGTLFSVITDKIKCCGDFRIWMEFCKNEGTLRELKHSPIIEH